MSLHKEINFENDVCDHLAAHGWLHADQDAAKYDRQLGLFPPDVLAWVQQTEPEAWDSLSKNHGAAAGTALLRRLIPNCSRSVAIAPLLLLDLSIGYSHCG